MGLHQHQVGQEVRFFPEQNEMGSRLDRYVISRLLPADTAGNPQYQITQPLGGHVLIVRENQLSLCSPTEHVA
jgi:hypothetical protein